MRMKHYAEQRNDPNKDVASNMSPYLHFGQIGAQALILRVKSAKRDPAGADCFVEEAVVRRELSDNFCFCKCVMWVWRMYFIWKWRQHSTHNFCNYTSDKYPRHSSP